MLTIEPAANGSPTARLDGRLLHSSRDPGREAERSCREIARRELPCVVMIGLGLGYQLEYLWTHTESTHCIVVEPEPQLIGSARTRPAMGPVLDSPRVHLADGPQSLDALLPRFAARGYEVVRLPGRTPVTDDRLASVDESLLRFSRRLSINRNTLRRFARLWVRNLGRNLDRLATGRPVSGLERAFAGFPGLLLAAGPTLDQILPVLPELAKRAVVVAVDTAVAPTVASGVEPDVAVVVDPQYWNTRHLDRISLGRTILVSEPSAHPAAFRAFRTDPYLCSSLFPLGRAYESVVGAMGSLGAGGSVATTAWDLMRLLGVSPIYVAGLDLGFPDGRTHCRDSYFEHRAVALGTRLTSAESVAFSYLWGADPVPVPDTAGGFVLSDRRMEVYRHWFSGQVSRPEAPPTACLTRGGAAVAGIRCAEASELLDRAACREQLAELRAGLLRRTDGYDPGIAARRRRAMDDRTRELLEALESLERLAARGLGAVERANRGLGESGRLDMDELVAIDAAIMNNPAGEIGSFLMQETIDRIAGGYGSASLAEQLDASASLYASLGDAARFHAETLRSSLLTNGA